MTHWLIQRGFDSDRQYLNLITALERMGVSHSFCTVVPFSDSDEGIKLETPLPEGASIFTYGSYSLSKHAVRRGYRPGAFLGIQDGIKGFTTDFDNLMKTPLAQHLLNADIHVASFKDETLPPWDRFFFKPNQDTKSWVAEVITRDDFLAFRDKILGIPEGEFSTVTRDTEYMASSVKVIDAEYRFFVVEGEVVTWSMYKRGDTVFYDANVDPYIVAFAQKMVNLYQPDRAYVMDVCTVNGECKIVEFNTINSSGLYAIDVQKFVFAVEGME